MKTKITILLSVIIVVIVVFFTGLRTQFNTVVTVTPDTTTSTVEQQTTHVKSTYKPEVPSDTQGHDGIKCVVKRNGETVLTTNISDLSEFNESLLNKTNMPNLHVDLTRQCFFRAEARRLQGLGGRVEISVQLSLTSWIYNPMENLGSI